MSAMGQPGRVGGTACKVTWVRAVACVCVIGLATLLPRLAWADTDMGQVEASIGEQEAETMTDLGPEGAPGVDVAGLAEEAITPPQRKARGDRRGHRAPKQHGVGRGYPRRCHPGRLAPL